MRKITALAIGAHVCFQQSKRFERLLITTQVDCFNAAESEMPRKPVPTASVAENVVPFERTKSNLNGFVVVEKTGRGRAAK